MAIASSSSSKAPAAAPVDLPLPRMIDNGRVELHGTIGTGAYGQVYLAIDRRYSQPAWRAVKCLRRNGLDARQKHFQRREIALHRLASSHPSIVHMDRLIEDGEHLYVVMDYGEEGDLFAMITDKQRYVGDDELIRSVFLQLVDGIAFLHSLGIAHRDVKPENIVCSEQGTRVRICDFGLATSEVESGEFGCGSTFYIAPECLGDWDPEQKSYPTRPGDVWSLGVILVNLVCGRNPWRIASPTDESFNAFLRDPYFLRRILPISEDCLYVLTRIFTLDPSERASLPELRQLITEVRSFTMTEEELLRAHAAASASTAPMPIVEEVYESTQFEFEEVHYETPALSADSGSPSPPTDRSRASSISGSLPPTPLLVADDALRPTTDAGLNLYDLLKTNPPSAFSHRRRELRINPPSPDVLSAVAGNPFFR